MAIDWTDAQILSTGALFSSTRYLMVFSSQWLFLRTATTKYQFNRFYDALALPFDSLALLFDSPTFTNLVTLT